MKRSATKPEPHPARFSPEIIKVFEKLIPAGMHVHDPYAGDGLRLGKMCDLLGLTFSGTEIEEPFIEDLRVKHGNSIQRRTYPRRRPYWIVTSPVYPNGMADHWEAQDGSKRKTYRWARAQRTGRDQELHLDNMARHGYRGTKRGGRSIKRSEYWRIAREVAECWDTAEAIVLNVSDFLSKSNGEIFTEPVVQDWIDMLKSLGWKVKRDIRVGTKRYRNGSDESRDQRVDCERVILLVKA